MAAPSQYLHIRIEGSFCVVIQKKDSYRVRACTAVNPDHLFVVNRQQIPYKPGDSFHFELTPDGLEPNNSWPVIDPAFDWSNKTTGNWTNKMSNYFITMDLPCPQQIQQDGTCRVTFDDNTSGLMPRNHILTYEIKDISKLKITCDKLGQQKIENGVFSLEIGLPLGTPDDQVRAHAIKCHNNMVQLFFPDLYKDKKCRLKDIGVETTTLECKSGGMIVGYP